MNRILPALLLAMLFAACQPSRPLATTARKNVLGVKALQTAHIGISIYEPATGQRWYDYQGDKYFVPASNTKIPTGYAAMKYLGDSLVGLRYAEADSQLYIRATGDPTFLHRDFARQPVFDFLKQSQKKLAYVLPGWEA